MDAPVLLDVAEIKELRLWDMVDEGMFVTRICMTAPYVANNAVATPAAGGALDHIHERVILETDLPLRIVRGLRPHLAD